MNVRTLSGISAFLALALLSWWLFNKVTSPTRSAAEFERHEPDLIMDQFKLTYMDPEGSPRYRLRAERMSHFPDDDSSILIKPHLEVIRDSSSTWRIDSETGWISSGAELVMLEGIVNIDRPEAPGHRAVTVTTHELLIKPEEKFAVTEQPAILRTDGTTVSAVGLRAYFEEGYIQLLSEVHGEYTKSRP